MKTNFIHERVPFWNNVQNPLVKTPGICRSLPYGASMAEPPFMPTIPTTILIKGLPKKSPRQSGKLTAYITTSTSLLSALKGLKP